jgi:hypothetical protein
MAEDQTGNPTSVADLVASGIPARLAPFLAQWDYVSETTFGRLAGLTDEEYLWEPAPGAWSIRPGRDGKNSADAEVWDATSEPAPPRSLAWTVTHLGNGQLVRADYLTGSHTMTSEDLEYPLEADAGLALMRRGLQAWRDGLVEMTDADLDTVGRSAYPGGLDPFLPLIEIVWWINKELIWHSAEAWLVRDLFVARNGQID